MLASDEIQRGTLHDLRRQLARLIVDSAEADDSATVSSVPPPLPKGLAETMKSARGPESLPATASDGGPPSAATVKRTKRKVAFLVGGAAVVGILGALAITLFAEKPTSNGAAAPPSATLPAKSEPGPAKISLSAVPVTGKKREAQRRPNGLLRCRPPSTGRVQAHAKF